MTDLLEAAVQMVTIRHPKLGGREIEVPRSAARIWERSGWELVEPAKPRPATRKSGATAEKKQGES